jgi:hydrogenase maturation protease
LPGVEVVDLDIKPAALLDHLPGPDRLVLADAVRVPGEAPGRVLLVDLVRDELPALLHDDAMSTHGLGLADQIALAGRLGLLPESVWLVGATAGSAEPESVAPGWMEEAVVGAHRRIGELIEGG